MDEYTYFKEPTLPMHRQYMALRRFIFEGRQAEEVAREFGYTVSTIYTLRRDFAAKLGKGEEPFFIERSAGRKKIPRTGGLADKVTEMRKRFMSVPEIKAALDADGENISERAITDMLESLGFARLPRRDAETRRYVAGAAPVETMEAEQAGQPMVGQSFQTENAGLLCFLPIIKAHGIDKAIMESDYPQTKQMPKLQSILSFLALKLSDIARYSADDVWCMDRGMGMFAGMTALPKAAWFSSYSSAITSGSNERFLRALSVIWRDAGMLSDTANLDFTAIPYWGDDDTLENNWNGKLHRALPSIQALLGQDPETGILCYADATVRHRRQSDAVLEFLDFRHPDPKKDKDLKYLVFDSKFTTYENLSIIDKQGVKFITIQRRCKSLESKIASLPDSSWKTARIDKANGRGRTIHYAESETSLVGYDGPVRQVFIKSSRRSAVATVITNDFDIPGHQIVRKYARRWLVDQDISEQVNFFHMNRNSSSIVVKVDFDLTMTLLAHNLYRLLAAGIDGYRHCAASTLYTKFIRNAGFVEFDKSRAVVKLKRKRALPLLIEALDDYGDLSYPWLDGGTVSFEASTTT